MSRRSIDVELLCDICSQNFDLTLCRPKVLPCGHTICKKCLHNPALEKKCPTCRKDLTVGPEDHPDNVFIIRMMTDGDGSPPCKVPRNENAKLEQLQRGLELGRKLVQQLQQMVPMAVAALNRQMESWAAQVRQLEEAVEREAAGGEEANSQELTTEQLELMAKLEDSVRLLSNDKCSVVAEGGECTWRASVQPGQFGNILHLLLLQLRADGPLEKVDDVAVPTNRAAFVGPPLISTLSIDKDRDIADGALKDSMELWCEEHCRVGSANFHTNPCLGRCRGVLNIPTAWSTVCKTLRESAPLQDTILELDSPTNINQDGQKKLLQVFATIRTGVACEIKITSNSQAIGFKWPLEPLHWNNYGTEADTGHHLKLLKLILAASSGTTEFQLISQKGAVPTAKVEPTADGAASQDSMELWCEEHCQVGSANFHTNPCLGRCRGVLNIPTAWSTVCKNLRESAPLQDTISELDSQTNINQDGQKKLLQVFAIIRTGVACEIKITSNSQAIRFKWPLEPLHWNNYGTEADTGHHLKLLKLLVAASGSTGFQLVCQQGVVPTAQDDGVPTSDPAASQCKQEHDTQPAVKLEAVYVARDDRKPTPESAQNSTTSQQETEQRSPIKTLLSKVKLRALCRKKPKSCDADDKLKQNVLESLEHTRVVNLEGLSCKEDEEFSLQLLERVRNHPELRSLEVRWPRRQHLEAINKIGQLKKLEIFADAKLRLKSGEVQLAKENGGLKKVKVDGLLPNTIKSLVEANSHSIEQLHVLVETPNKVPFLEVRRKKPALKISIPDAELLGLEGLPQKCYPAPISHQDMAGIIKLCASSCPNMTTICLERLTGHRHGPCPGQKEIYRAMLPSSILLYCKTCDKRDSKENPF